MNVCVSDPGRKRVDQCRLEGDSCHRRRKVNEKGWSEESVLKVSLSATGAEFD